MSIASDFKYLLSKIANPTIRDMALKNYANNPTVWGEHHPLPAKPEGTPQDLIIWALRYSFSWRKSPENYSFWKSVVVAYEHEDIFTTKSILVDLLKAYQANNDPFVYWLNQIENNEIQDRAIKNYKGIPTLVYDGHELTSVHDALDHAFCFYMECAENSDMWEDVYMVYRDTPDREDRIKKLKRIQQEYLSTTKEEENTEMSAKEQMIEASRRYLNNKCVVFHELNNGIHFKVEGPNSYIDFWPTTGKWKTEDGKDMFGMAKLVTYVKNEEEDDD